MKLNLLSVAMVHILMLAPLKAHTNDGSNSDARTMKGTHTGGGTGVVI